jgi:hypothetical protein
MTAKQRQPQRLMRGSFAQDDGEKQTTARATANTGVSPLRFASVEMTELVAVEKLIPPLRCGMTARKAKAKARARATATATATAKTNAGVLRFAQDDGEKQTTARANANTGVSPLCSG